MATAELIEQTTSQKPEIVAYLQQKAMIAVLADKYMGLTISGLDDRKGFDAVHAARMTVKNTRVAVEKRRKELKADALAYGQAVDAAARELTGLLTPIESHLEAEEQAVVDAREKIKREAEERRRQIAQDRYDKLIACGVMPSLPEVAALTDEQFAVALADAEKIKAEREAAELARQKAEAEAAEKRRAEEAKLAAERAELEAMRKQQEADAARLKAESDRLAAEEQAKQRAIELEKAKAEAAEKARIETEKRLAEEAAMKVAADELRRLREKEEADAAEAARLKAEAERPQREKILAVAEAVEALEFPAGPGSDDVKAVLANAAAAIRVIARRRNLKG